MEDNQLMFLKHRAGSDATMPRRRWITERRLPRLPRVVKWTRTLSPASGEHEPSLRAGEGQEESEDLSRPRTEGRGGAEGTEHRR